MKSSVILEEFSRVGGGQMVANSIAKVLDGKFVLNLITDKHHPKLNRSLFSRIVETRYSYYEGINLLSLVSRIRKLSVDLKKNEQYIRSHDLSINVHPNIFLFNADINVIHEPFLYENSEFNTLAKHLISEMIRISKVYSIYTDARFLVAGTYIKNKIVKNCEYLGIKPTVRIVHYPVSYPLKVDFRQKKKYVLTFGRINRDKGLETVLEIASYSKVMFIIAGAINVGSEGYFSTLLSKKSENVQIIPNPSEDKKNELFSEATVYLHTKFSENYGLSVAEAIGFGCIPIVPKNGGPWEDIVEFGKYGFGYLTSKEAADIINNVINDDLSRYKYIYDSKDRFSFDQFKENFLELVDSVVCE